MTATFVSLLVILLIALAGPLIAGVIPHKPIPEVVFLIFLGALLGPNMAGAFTLTEGVETVSELGVAFLFLIAGYEINPRELAGNMGKTAAGTWVVCFGVALGLVALLFGEMPGSLHDLALAIVLTTTAYGTLAPILKERGIMGTPVGKAVVAHGVVGELFPVLAIAILLSTRARWEAVLIVLLFFAIAAVLAFVPARARKMGAGIYRAIESLRETNAQTMVRFTMVLLLALVALSAIFDLDVVLGAFVAGVVLHYIIPEGDHALEHKIESMGFGLFIPVFFVVSGAGIDLAAVAGDPLLLLGAVAAILVARGVPVFVSTFVSKQTRDFGVMQRLEVTLYSTMALPLIVAVCSIAVDGGFMLPEVSSTLITAGALTVLIIPVLASLTRTVVDAHPVATVQDLVAFPDRRDEVLAMYRAARRDARERYRAVRKKSDEMFLPDPDASEGVLADFARRRAELLNELRSEELHQTVMGAQADPVAWERAIDERQRRWEKMKSEGDAAWEHIKQLGDKEISSLRQHGVRYAQERLASVRHASELLGKMGEGHGSSKAADPFARQIRRVLAREREQGVSQAQGDAPVPTQDGQVQGGGR